MTDTYDAECATLATMCRRHGFFEVALCFEELRIRRDAPAFRGFDLTGEKVAFSQALLADITAYALRLS